MRLFVEAPGVIRVDLDWRGIPGQIASYLLVDGDDLAVLEPGPGSTLRALLRALELLGRDPAEVSHILVTHVHLDHAGAAGALASLAPGAMVHVHPLGAPHLVDPSRLLASATRIYGDRMDALWGTMQPLDAGRVRPLSDGERVVVGRRALVAVDTPGHARHHHAFHEPETGLLFGGDVTGIRLDGMRYVRPPTPPPELDVEAWLGSLARLRALRPTRVMPTHFGGSADVEWHLDELAARLRDWAEWGRRRIAAGDDLDALSGALRDKARGEALAVGGSEDDAAAYEDAVPSAMLASGLLRYLSRR